MSKPLSRVAIALLIGLIIIAGVVISAQAASANTGYLKGRVDMTAGDSYYLNQQRGAAQKLSPYNTNNFNEGYECERDKGVSSNDY